MHMRNACSEYAIDMTDFQYRPLYFLHLSRSLFTVASVHGKRYIRAPVTSATLHDWNQNSRRLNFMFISSHEHEHCFSNETQRLVYRRPTTTPRHETTSPRNEECSSLFHGTLPIYQTSHLMSLLLLPTIVKIIHF